MKPSDSVHSEMQPVQAGITVRTACVHESATREGLTSPPDLHNRRTSVDVFDDDIIESSIRSSSRSP